MLNERYTQLNESIHADDTLIDRTLDAIDAATTKTRPRSAGFRLAVGFVCALVLLVVAAARIVPPPKDVVAASNKTDDTEDLLPLQSPSPDDLTLTVHNLALLDEHTLTFILTVRGEKIDRHTMIGYTVEQFIFDSCTVAAADAIIPPAANERSFLFTMKYKHAPILEQIGDSYQMAVFTYTARSQRQKFSLTPDWATMDYALPPKDESLPLWTGKPLYQLDDHFSVTAFALNEDAELIVEVRWPATAGFDSSCIPTLHDAVSGIPYFVCEAHPVLDEHYTYYQYTFGVDRDDLPGMMLEFDANLSGEIIEGSWPFTVDLTQLTAE